MDRTRVTRWLAAARRSARRLHSGRVSAQQRLHLAALLIVALPLAAQDISFDPRITDAEFEKFSRVIAQGIYPTPVQPARATGLLGFDVGVAGTAVSIDKNSLWWQYATDHDFSTNGYVGVPRLVASKGFGFATISGSYAKLGSSGIKTYGATVDFPIFRGTVVTPEIALRGSYATITGADVFKQKVYGAEAFISKGFGPVMPYAAIGRTLSDSTGTITVPVAHSIHDQSKVNRITAGVRLSLLVPKIAVEVTKAEVTSYAAKVSFGF
jgi:hypothetical protein